MHWTTLLLHIWLLNFTTLNICCGLDLDELLPKVEYENCTSHADCAENECCTFEAEATLSTSTQIIWRCKPLGDMDQICHSLASVYCPCKAGLRCVPKAVWFFGAGLCKKK